MNNSNLVREISEKKSQAQTKMANGLELTAEDISSLFLLNFLEEEQNEKSS